MSEVELPAEQNVGRYSILLGALALMLVALPFVDATPVSSVRFRLLLSIVLLAGIGAVANRRSTLIIGGVLLIGFLVPSWLAASFDISDALSHLGFVSGALLLCLAIAVILVSLIQTQRVTLDTILGGICVYLLFGVVFGVAMLLTEQLSPGSFGISPAVDSVATLATRLLYLSFVTLTGLGYGDVVPLVDRARMLCAAEAVVGQLYLAIFIARLLGLHLSESQRN